MARSTWCRIIYWAGVDCARAVHVQIFYLQGTVRLIDPPERGWCRLRVDRRHVARGTCRRVKVYQKFPRAPGGQTVGVAEPKLAGHTRTVPT